MILGKLIGYNTQTDSMENGSPLPDVPFKKFLGVIDDPNYEDISSIENWHNYRFKVDADYTTTRLEIRALSIDISYASPHTWNTTAGYTNTEKDIIIDYYLFDNDFEKVVHLMTTKGLTQAAAIKYLQEAFAKHHIKDVKDCQHRAQSEYVYTLIAKYLSLSDAAVFFSLVQNLFNAYTSQAIKGTLDGNVGLGLFDFIESTPGTIYENAGLANQGFTMQNGDPNTNNLVSDLMLWFRNGIKV